MTEPIVRLNCYQNQFDNTGSGGPGTWFDLLQLLSEHIETPNKRAVRLFNLVVFEGKRCIANAVKTRAMVLDFDHLTGEELARARCTLMPYECFWYTTHSYRYQERAVRCVLLLDRDVGVEAFDSTWSQLQELLSGKLDSQCRDISHFYYYPSHAPGAEFWTEYNPGKPYPAAGEEYQAGRKQGKQVKQDLAQYTKQLADAFARAFPEGSQLRHKACLPLAGLLIKEGWPQDRATECLESLLAQTGWEYSDTEASNCVQSSLQRASTDQHFSGYTKLAEMLQMLGKEGGQALDNFTDAINLKLNGALATNPKTGGVLPLDSNLETILGTHPACSGALAFDEFRQDIIQVGSMPATITGRAKREPSWSDVDATRVGNWIAKQYRFNVPKGKIHEQCEALAKKNTFHPVRDYLRSLKWDGTPRLSFLFSRYFGADDSRYMQAVSRMFMIGAIARVMKPGCKLDTAPILVGGQGRGKSKTLAALVPKPEWFTDTRTDIRTKDAMLNLAGTWIYEFAELASMKSADVETVKSFLSSGTDKFRIPYERRATQHPRQIVFVGSVNGDDGETVGFKDKTGNRRFWPVQVLRQCNTEALVRDREQLWAEAYAAQQAGEQWWGTPEIEALCLAVQEENAEQDPWDSEITEYLDNLCTPTLKAGAGGLILDKSDPWDGVTTHQILKQALGKATKDQTNWDSQRVAKILRDLGWKQKGREYREGGRARIYIPGHDKPEDWKR